MKQSFPNKAAFMACSWIGRNFFRPNLLFSAYHKKQVILFYVDFWFKKEVFIILYY